MVEKQSLNLLNKLFLGMYDQSVVKGTYTTPYFSPDGIFRLLFIARPLAGKGTQSRLLMQRYGFQYVSTGDWVRYHIKGETKLGQEVMRYNDAGLLVPDDVIIKLFNWGMEEYNLQGKSVIFDGFPRTIPQMNEIEKHYSINLAIELDVGEQVIRDQRIGRLTCPKCQAIYHPITARPKISGVCDADGKILEIRKDDQPETVERRLGEFNRALPVAGAYEWMGRKLTLDGERKVDEISGVLKYHVGYLLVVNALLRGEDPKPILEQIYR